MNLRTKKALNKKGKLVITGRVTGETRLIVLSIPRVMYDALRMLSVVKGVKGGAKRAAQMVIEENRELKSVLEYLKNHDSIEERRRIIANMEETQ